MGIRSYMKIWQYWAKSEVNQELIHIYIPHKSNTRQINNKDQKHPMYHQILIRAKDQEQTADQKPEMFKG